MSWRESWALPEEIGTTGHPKNCLVLVWAVRSSSKRGCGGCKSKCLSLTVTEFDFPFNPHPPLGDGNKIAASSGVPMTSHWTTWNYSCLIISKQQQQKNRRLCMVLVYFGSQGCFYTQGFTRQQSMRGGVPVTVGTIGRSRLVPGQCALCRAPEMSLLS